MRLFFLIIFNLGLISQAQAIDVRCAMVDVFYQQTDEYLLLSVAGPKGESKILETNSARLKDFPAAVIGKTKVCKRPGMRFSNDFENSYEVCGISVDWKFSGGKTNLSLVRLESNFNSQFSILPSYTHSFGDPGTTKSDGTVIPTGIDYDAQLAQYETQDGKLGHIYSYDLTGKLVGVLRVQCSADLLKVKVLGAVK